jgi:DNA-binding NtrC family response regulator/pSer/pThr/pTyr-binding forkhead associated (FHA) protein
MPALLLLSGPSAGLRFDVKLEAVLGRSPSCEIPLEDHKVSRRHAKIVVQDGEVRISDLGSRNGTAVNGEKIDAEAILLPGDRVQVGDTTALFEPPSKASFAAKERTDVNSVMVEELLPRVGSEAALYSAGIALLTATSEAMVLRRAAEEMARSLSADRAAALLGGTEGLMTAAVVGADSVEVPRSVVKVALEKMEASLSEGIVCAPLAASGGSPFGILYAERNQSFTDEEERLAAALGRLAGEAFAVVRSRADREAPEVVLVGSSRQFRRTVEQARRAAAASDGVLLYGEVGTGKALTALYIHGRSTRALGPFVEVDCRSPRVQEELFGRASGPGVPPLSSALLRADGGTLLLRHVEGLPRHDAERLARYIQHRNAPARGGGEEPVDVRVIGTAPGQLQHLVARSEIDPELAKALAGTEIEALPLRERRTDVPALFDLFAERVVRALRKELPQLSPDAKRLLVDYAWPHNVAELKLVAERIATLYPGQEVSSLHVPPEVQEGGDAGKTKSLQDMISRLERDAIAEALRAARGKKIRAAAILGISRPTLDKKIEDYNLVVEKIRSS